MPAPQLADLESRVIASRYKNFDPNGFVVDGWLLPQPPAKAFAAGKIQQVDLLAGLNGRELSAFRLGAAAAARQSAQPAQKSAPTDAVKKLADAAHPLYGARTGAAGALYAVQILLHGDIAVDRAGNDMLMACPVGGDPTSAALPTWKPWNGNDEPYLEFTPSGDVLPLRNFSPPFCRLAPQGLKERLLE